MQAAFPQSSRKDILMKKSIAFALLLGIGVAAQAAPRTHPEL